MSTMHAPPVAFDSAYPGSMFSKAHGSYVLRDDPASLAAALLEGVVRRDREISDLRDALYAAHDALREIALAGMSGTGEESEEGMQIFHARQAWSFIGIAARALPNAKAKATRSQP